MAAVSSFTSYLQIFLSFNSRKCNTGVTRKYNTGVTRKYNTGVTRKCNTGVTRKCNTWVTRKYNTGVTRKYNTGVTRKCNTGVTRKQWNMIVVFFPFHFEISQLFLHFVSVIYIYKVVSAFLFPCPIITHEFLHQFASNSNIEILSLGFKS